jgi:hypothetical protein
MNPPEGFYFREIIEDDISQVVEVSLSCSSRM